MDPLTLMTSLILMRSKEENRDLVSNWKMGLSIQGNGIKSQEKEMEEESKSGLMEADMKVIGGEIRQMGKED